MPTCKNCGREFPNRMVIDGKERILTSREFCLDCSPFGKHNTIDITRKPRGGAIVFCTLCKTYQPSENFYKQTRTRRPLSYCKKCFNLKVSQRTHRIKQQAIDYKGGKCRRCGYNGCASALEFHHRDPRHKDVQISKNHNRSFDRLKPELDKCVLLCSNCHRELHEGLISLDDERFE